jgi:hypothetical protein
MGEGKKMELDLDQWDWCLGKDPIQGRTVVFITGGKV